MAGEEYRVPPGRYDLLVEYFGQKFWRRGEELAGGDNVIKLPMGTLVVEVRSSRGENLDARVAVMRPGVDGGPAAMEGGAFEPLAVIAGVYDVRVTVQGRERWIRGVALGEGDAARELLVEPVGYLRVDAVNQKGEPLPADVWVYGPASDRTPAAVGTGGRPLALVPGSYNIAVRWQETRDYSAAVEVLENQTTVERFNFWQAEER